MILATLHGPAEVRRVDLFIEKSKTPVTFELLLDGKTVTSWSISPKWGLYSWHLSEPQPGIVVPPGSDLSITADSGSDQICHASMIDILSRRTAFGKSHDKMHVMSLDPVGAA